MEETAEHFPECLPWVWTCYGTESFLKFGDTVIVSGSGLHQGDPLAGLLFCLVLHPVIKLIQEQLPSLSLNAWYLDDGHVIGSKEELAQVPPESGG